MKESLTAALPVNSGGTIEYENSTQVKPVKVKTKKTYPVFYTKGEEIFNAVTHIVGGAFGLAALITLSILSYGDSVKLASSIVFGISIIILYTMSALYHFLPNNTGKYVFRIFDHCTIFLLIAGTYTPYCLIALGGTKLGFIILIVEWVLAAAGITANAIAMKSFIVRAISMVFYVAMGWMIVLAFDTLLVTLSPASFWLLLFGGVAYTTGLIFFGFGKKVKYFHSIWHLFDLAGTALQFVSILLMVVL
jgi:hemolysin III